MKKAKKILALAACAVLLVCMSVGATLAYLYANSEVVTNTFTVGDIKIKLDEAKLKAYDPTNNTYEATDDGARVTRNNYKLRPGIVMAKDPTVYIKNGSERAYIRMFVTITDWENVKAAMGADFLPEAVVDWNSAQWPCEKYEVVGDDLVLEYRYYTDVNFADETPVAEYSALEPLFTKVTIPGELTGDDMAKLQNVQIIVRAEAMQADGFATAADAWAAWTYTPAQGDAGEDENNG